MAKEKNIDLVMVNSSDSKIYVTFTYSYITVYVDDIDLASYIFTRAFLNDVNFYFLLVQVAQRLRSRHFLY